MQETFIHLHCHSEYSLLEGAVRVKQLLKKCKEYDMSSVALTDNGTMYGTIDFYLQAKAKNINPIIGCEMFLVPDLHQKSRGFDRLLLLCKDYIGYQNLVVLTTIAYLDGFYYKPRIDIDTLAKHSEGLIAISPGMKGPVGYNLRNNNKEDACIVASKFKDIYKDDFYLGVQRIGEPLEDIVFDQTIEIHQQLDIPIVATNDVYYLEKEQAYLKDVLGCIQKGKILDQTRAHQTHEHELLFKSPDEMKALFSDYPEAIENTVKIAAKCQVDIETEQVKLPKFSCPNNQTAPEYLKELVLKGVEKKYDKITQEIKERVAFELDIINRMQYAPYFLIIDDFLQFARDSQIPIGPGRGSAAGSIVAYALDITKIDPLRYNLLFERFLNPDRISMPDIDLDFCIKRRSEVIDYITKHYGEDHVSQIITFGTMAARGVIRDVGRVLNVPLNEVDYIAKLVPSAPGHASTLKEALDEVNELKKLYNSQDSCKQLLDIGQQLEGFPRHTSTHAAGVVISRDPLSTIVPLAKNEGQSVTQYQMTDLERVGLLKMDILGLRNLTVLNNACNLIFERHNKRLDLDNLSLDDEKTYQLLCSGETVGVFQLESQGMRGIIKDLKPQVFEDIVALLALYRPGPLGSGMVSDFISNKSGETEVQYDLPELEPILKETYGLILYQEQVMQIASTIGGFTLAEADMLRRAMGKKKKAVMNRMRDQFIDGAKEKDIDTRKAKHVFDLCCKFAEYGFNKSHSAAYALISYQTAYLKANYPNEYMSVLLSSVMAFTDKTALYIQECKNMGIKVLSPDVSKSKMDFIIESHDTQGECIRFGLSAIKNVGEGAIESIIEKRADDTYDSIMDFCLKVDLKQVNKRVLESLVKSGAMDQFGDRGYLLSIFERVLENAQILVKERKNGQTSLFQDTLDDAHLAVPQIDVDEAPALSSRQILQLEKEVLGLYVSGHPLDEIKDKLDRLKYHLDKLQPDDDGKVILVGGLLTDCRKVITKTKREMLIGKLTDLKGVISILLFSSPKFNELSTHFRDDNLVYITGRVRVHQGEVSLICEDIELIDYSKRNKRVYIDASSIQNQAMYQSIKGLCSQYPGSMQLYFKLEDTIVLANKKYWLLESDECIEKMETLLGPGYVWVT